MFWGSGGLWLGSWSPRGCGGGRGSRRGRGVREAAPRPLLHKSGGVGAGAAAALGVVRSLSLARCRSAAGTR